MADKLSNDEELASWASLLDLSEAECLSERNWRADELGQVLKHQLCSPIQLNLRSVDGVDARRLESLCLPEEAFDCSFGDLLRHPHPSIELLEMTKQYAKACHARPDAIIPKEIALVLYYAAIVAAWLRRGRRITELDDKDLAKGVRWTLRQEWIDESLRRLLNEGLDRLRA